MYTYTYIQARHIANLMLRHRYMYMYMYMYIHIHGWLSLFLHPGSANAAKLVVPPHGNKEKGGLERWFKGRKED